MLPSEAAGILRDEVMYSGKRDLTAITMGAEALELLAWADEDPGNRMQAAMNKWYEGGTVMQAFCSAKESSGE